MSHSWTAGPRDPAELLYWQLDENSYLNLQDYNMPLIEDTHSVTAQILPPSQQEPSFFERSLSRDHALGYLGLRFNHTTYAPPASPHGAPTSFAFSPGPDALDQDGGLHWTQGGVPFELQDSYGYGPSSPVQSAALSDFEPSVAASSEKTQPQHAQVKLIAFNSCQQCHERFQNKTKLDDHAKETQHRTYACICGEPFSRFDCLNRHLDKFNPRVLHPCLYCSKYSGSNAFHRRDHLIQHLRNFHHHSNPDETHDQQVPFPLKRVARKSITACPHDGCAYHSQASTTSFFGNSQQLVFRTQKEFTRHLREVHDESPFPCPELGCNRVGGKGYFRRRDLLKHQVEHASTSQVGSPVQSDQFMFP